MKIEEITSKEEAFKYITSSNDFSFLRSMYNSTIITESKFIDFLLNGVSEDPYKNLKYLEFLRDSNVINEKQFQKLMFWSSNDKKEEL